MRFDITTADVRNSNDRVYTLETVEQMRKKINASLGLFFVTLNSPYPSTEEMDMDRVAGSLKDAQINDGVLSAEFILMDTPTGKIVETLLKDERSLSMSTMGTGKLNSENVVYDYALKYAFLHTGDNA